MIYRLPIVLLPALCGLVLSACESTPYARAPEQPATIDLTAPQPAPEAQTRAPTDISRLSNAAGVRPAPEFPSPRDRDLMVMTDKLSGGSVEIYDLDRPDGTTFSAPVSGTGGIGMPSAVDPNVIVYPIDGETNYPGAESLSKDRWPNSLLPMNAGGASRGGPEPAASLYFSHGSASLDAKDREILGEVAKRASRSRISVEGHASSRVQTKDPVEGRILNLKESMNRAFEVSRSLIKSGMPAENIKTVGWGDAMSSADGNENAARRVDIVAGGR